jgi:type I restriction-modification system DNA methylase subunit
LEECGYTGNRLKEGYAFGPTTIMYVGFVAKPWDFDSACVAVVAGDGDSEAVARSCRGMGAPIVWVSNNGTVDWWAQHGTGPTLFASKPLREFAALVQRYKAKLDPVTVYRGKTIARVDKSRQLDFVDAGLLPLLRDEAGKKLHDLVEEMIHTTLEGLDKGEPSKEELRKVFTAVFRLLAGKILKDKGVRGFKGLDLANPTDVLAAVGRHYNASQAILGIDGKWETALASAASRLGQVGSLDAVSPEALAYVYEHTLVTKSLRKKLGIHATPPWLVDYMVWRLYDWICDIPENDRHVFEPACGHAPFLLSAMRLLRLERSDKTEREVHEFLKSHMHGLEIDDFAREIARLSLTLADIPNPNGWDLRSGDMYASAVLQQEAARCRLLLSNPPYEAFTASEKEKYRRSGFPGKGPKAIELLDRTLAWLPEGAVFALVLPQGFLHGTEARGVREILLRDFEIREICLFADKVFEEGEPESVVVLGRRRMGEATAQTVCYLRVREGGIEKFQETYQPDSRAEVNIGRFGSDPNKSLLVPDLPEVWTALGEYPPLSTVADVGQGFSFAKKGLLAEARKRGRIRTEDAVPAFLEGHRKVAIWDLPPTSWLSPSRTPVKPWRSGQATSKPQVLVNYVRAMRGPWRVKAFLDYSGQAAINKYLTVRPKPGGPPIEFLWAVLNSPIGNAYTYCHTMRKHNYDGLLAKLPLPRHWEDRVRPVMTAARAYLQAVEPIEDAALRVENEAAACEALLALDAAVLRAYDLPVRLERTLLELFRLPKDKKEERRRKGVGCLFGDYYPPGFTSYLPLYIVISDRFRRAAADATADRFRPDESAYVRDVLNAAADKAEE